MSHSPWHYSQQQSIHRLDEGKTRSLWGRSYVAKNLYANISPRPIQMSLEPFTVATTHCGVGGRKDVPGDVRDHCYWIQADAKSSGLQIPLWFLSLSKLQRSNHKGSLGSDPSHRRPNGPARPRHPQQRAIVHWKSVSCMALGPSRH